jgi:DeoR family fructose operon transcriptional repressor
MENTIKETLFAEERKSQILELLKSSSKILVNELCDHFDVSPATIRNDLRELENGGFLKRTHGGAISNTKTGYELNSYQKEVTNHLEKEAIARFSFDLIENGDTILLDTGTTTLELARLLGQKRDITVVVNDIEIARYLEDNTDINVILIGGALRQKFHCTVGPIALKALEGLSVDKAFMAANGITAKKGLTTPDLQQAEVKRAMIEIASEVIVLCDSSKIGYNAFAQFAQINSISRLITDNKADEKILDEIRAWDVPVDIVNIQ